MEPWSKMASQTSLLLVLPNRDLPTGPKASESVSVCAFVPIRDSDSKNFAFAENGIGKTGSFAARNSEMAAKTNINN
jgi:hypothetical protein